MASFSSGSTPNGPPQPSGGEDQPGSVLTGASGMVIISEMFQRQARRLEAQQQLQQQDRKAVENTQAQLLVMQAQLQWHAARYQERAEQVNNSSETISRMQSYLGAMETEREHAVEQAQSLARDVFDLRQQVETSQPEKYATLSTTLSDMAMQVRRSLPSASADRDAALAWPFPHLPPPRWVWRHANTGDRVAHGAHLLAHHVLLLVQAHSRVAFVAE